MALIKMDRCTNCQIPCQDVHHPHPQEEEDTIEEEEEDMAEEEDGTTDGAEIRIPHRRHLLQPHQTNSQKVDTTHKAKRI